uniref:Uncharacterized protein n=1 Tax=Anguilla anguilla TaxID=7936 RepID=A0A0E9RS77_ANGAN
MLFKFQLVGSHEYTQSAIGLITSGL